MPHDARRSKRADPGGADDRLGRTSAAGTRLAVALWEVGNENYGPWETDNHPNPHTPASYAQNAAPFFQAIHQADPAARIGFPFALTAQQAPGTGTGVTDPAQWNATILREGGKLPVAALFAAGTALEWLSQGAESVDWWDIHNDGSPQGDFGMLSSGTGGEPTADTPFPAYDGYALASLLTAPGARLSALNTSSPTVTAFASRGGSRDSVLVINSDPARPAPVSVRGMSGTLRSYSYSAASPQISQGTTTASAARAGITVPPESIEVLQG